MTPIQEQLEHQIKNHCDAQQWDEATRIALIGYGPEIMGWVVGMLSDEDSSEDICQLFSIAVWRGLPAFRWESSFRVWAYRVAWRELLQFLRRRTARRERQIATSELRRIAQDASSLHTMLQRKQVASGLVALRQKLPEEMQSLLILRVDRELSFLEISHILEITEEAARQKFKRAKDKLKEMAKSQGLL